jgi:HD-GYP domain-containing protein (c-di-GMP phosphodiesterase class II)
MQAEHAIPVEEAVQVLAIVGDLSMGQPTDQSARTARLAGRLAQEAGATRDMVAHARLVAMLRWTGCTANASGFATLLGDDVQGRHAMLAQLLSPGHPLDFASVAPLAQVHCEVSGDLAQMLGLPEEVQGGLRHIFEHFDGNGLPMRLRGSQVPELVYHVNLASDLDILARVRGIAEALEIIERLADRKYPARLVQMLAPHARAWLEDLERPEHVPAPAQTGTQVPLRIVADLTELKLPWLAGYSRRVADLAERSAALAGMTADQQACVGRAALLHGAGRAAIPNTVWERDGALSRSDWERVRLVPYWTERIATHVAGLRAEVALASHVYERADGSGYFRSLGAAALGTGHQLLAAAAAYVALCMPRPWRAAYTPAQAARVLLDEVEAGKFDAQAVAAVLAASGIGEAPRKPNTLLTERETEVLQRISLGESNKEAARALQISPSTVRTHIESVFRKLGCSTRAAATLKALNLGLI